MSDDLAHDPNYDLQKQLQEARDLILEQQDEIIQLSAAPLHYGTVISSTHTVDHNQFKVGDRVVVIDKTCGSYFGKIGTIISEVDVVSGTVRVDFFGKRQKPRFRIGLAGVIDPDTGEEFAPQVHLLCKNDGSNIVICLDGKIQEVWNTFRFNPEPGDIAKCNLKSNQVVEIQKPLKTGDLCSVTEASSVAGENRIEVEIGGNKKIVWCYFQNVEVGDRVILDPGGVIVVHHVSNDATKRFKLREETRISWDDIGGQDEAREEMQEAILWPIENPELFQFYNKQMPAGFLLYGPPGCGKTMIGQATAHSLAETHGADAVQSGFNYIKGPEILSMWVGESEAQSRAVFARMRKHYETHGYPSVTFVDEADAIFCERGSAQGQKWHDTLIAMWLAEMDGFDRKGGMIILATNRSKALDGAVVRPGRIDCHIRVPRPNREAAIQITGIHLQGVPLHRTDLDAVKTVCCEELFDNTRPIYQVHDNATGENHIFALEHLVSGSMIASIIEIAKSKAFRRDRENRKMCGCHLSDFRDAVSLAYRRHQALNHKFDLIDFCETKGIDEKKVKLEKLQAVG
jgi:ATP-dependent 26S proteasome regulatory subunit